MGSLAQNQTHMLFFTIAFFKLFPRYTGMHSTAGCSVRAAQGSQCQPEVAHVQLVLSHPVILQPCLSVFEGLLSGTGGSWWWVAQSFSTCSRGADRRIAGCRSTNCMHCRRALKNTPLTISHYWPFLLVIFPRTSLPSFLRCHNSFCEGWLESVEVSGEVSIESVWLAASEPYRFAPIVFLILVLYGRFGPQWFVMEKVTYCEHRS